MANLIVDRFLILDRDCTIDIASSDQVDLRLDRAGSRPEQQDWTERCARELADSRSRLIDFGFIGTDRRFEATARRPRPAFVRSETVDHVLEWLEKGNLWSARIFFIPRSGADQSGGLARELRLRGFIPLSRAVFGDARLEPAIGPALSGRSVVLLNGEDSTSSLALGFLKLLSARARSAWAVVGPAPGAQHSPLVAHAAEGHAAFGQPAASRRFGLRSSGSIADVHAIGMIDEARRLLARGRHAAAERSLRATLAAFDRRNDVLHAGDAGLVLGRLLLSRGRAADARTAFDLARAKYETKGAAAEAIDACVYAGLAQTDLGFLPHGEETLRSAYSGATALRDSERQLTSAVALARSLYWQNRNADGCELLQVVTPQGGPEARARYWCCMARLRLTGNDLTGAWDAARCAREATREATHDEETSLAVETTVRTAEAMVQGRLGDIEALEWHVRLGMKAAKGARLPLAAVRLRVVWLEGLVDAKRTSMAREVGARLRAISRVALPPLLARRIVRVLDRLASPSAHETAPAFSPIRASISQASDVDGLTQLFAICHDSEDERAGLTRAAAAIRKHAGAVAVGIFGAGLTDALPLGTAGTVSSSLGHRGITLGLQIPPERSSGGFEAATPVRYLGRVIGSVACRWSLEGPMHADQTMAFVAAAAAACAPLVYTLLERDAVTSREPVDESVDLIGVSAAMDEVRRVIARAANAPFTILIEGESGSGKEVVARALHRSGCRRQRRLCALNCAAMPEDLIDAELFGHAKGAFTGAAAERVGLFEDADQGTVFLDEVGELSPRAQAKLLRVLQEGEIRRIGENFTRPIDARLIAATNRSLRAEVDAGRFRQDLLYRLDVIRISVPPLRDRVEDIPLLAARFWRQAADRMGSKAVLGPGALSVLARYDWPGNVRELQNVLSGLVVAVPPRGVVGAAHIPAAIAHATRPAASETLDIARLRFEQRFVRAALARTAGHRGQTATALGVSRQGLSKLMQRLQIDD